MTLHSFPVRGRRRHPERDYEDQVVAYLQNAPHVVDVGRQVRIRGAGIADVCFYAQFPDDDSPKGIAQILGVVEVKAVKAGETAFLQMLRYMKGLNDEFSDYLDNLTITGILAAPRFEPWIEEYASRKDNSFGIFRL